ncbi:MAG: CBS domain-containing protein [Candidatus Tectimicrobiota bacterium]
MSAHIREFMLPQPMVLPGTTSVYEAACAMWEAAIDAVLVMEHQQVCGLVTASDIGGWIMAAQQDPATTPLAALCSHTLLLTSLP